MGKIYRHILRGISRRAKEVAASFNVARLSHPEVATILQSDELSYVGDGNSAIKGYVTNQLRANVPLEDTRAEAKLIHSNGMVFGIYDGHGGPSCARVLAKRLFNYVAVPLLNSDQRQKFIKDENNTFKLTEHINDLYDWRENRDITYDQSLKSWAKDLENNGNLMSLKDSLIAAFERLDADIGKAAEAESGLSLLVAMSGAVACVAAVNDLDLNVAWSGDCQAVLGQQAKPGDPWMAKKLTVEHTCENEEEVYRIKKEHPFAERNNLIQEGRLFHSLVPLRAFGDYRYKWNVEQLEKLAVPTYGRNAVPSFYFTPPYLTVTPDVYTHKLTADDKFLIIASDGLWDVLSPQMAVQLVGDHLSGKPSVLKFQLHKFKDLFPSHETKALDELTPVDKNAATHLIRATLGGGHEIVSKQLSFPSEHVRIIRDDITVTVIYFDSNFITKGSRLSGELSKNPPVAAKNTPPKQEKIQNAGKETAAKEKTADKTSVWEDIESKDDIKFLNVDLERAIATSGGGARSLGKKLSPKVSKGKETKLKANLNNMFTKEKAKVVKCLQMKSLRPIDLEEEKEIESKDDEEEMPSKPKKKTKQKITDYFKASTSEKGLNEEKSALAGTLKTGTKL